MARNAVLTDCKEGSASKPGLFTFTVPTGGGKTLSFMEFALRHATVNGLERVIYAIPFTSIVKQSATMYYGLRDYHKKEQIGREKTASTLSDLSTSTVKST